MLFKVYSVTMTGTWMSFEKASPFNRAEWLCYLQCLYTGCDRQERGLGQNEF